MRSAFDTQRADLTRMTDTDELLWIDEVHHQVFVIHDIEHGTPFFLGRVDDPRG